MPIKIEWLSLAIGVALGLLLCKGMNHSKSPISFPGQGNYSDFGIS